MCKQGRRLVRTVQVFVCEYCGLLQEAFEPED